MPDDLFPELESKGIKGCVAVQAAESAAETDFLLKLSDEYEWIKKVVGWIDFDSENLERDLENYSQKKKLAGFRKALQAYPTEAMEAPNFLKGIGLLQKFGFTYDILIYPNHLEAAYVFAEKFPYQPFVVDHLAKPNIRNGEFDYWSKGITKLASLPNVNCKVSGMVTEAHWQNWKVSDFKPYLDFIIQNFNKERLMYGSDWPVCLVAADYGKVYDLANTYFQEFSISEKEKIFGGNACRFYGIKE